VFIVIPGLQLVERITLLEFLAHKTGDLRNHALDQIEKRQTKETYILPPFYN
jgi:hypothetical protein